jgi:hypothetical protein
MVALGGTGGVIARGGSRVGNDEKEADRLAERGEMLALVDSVNKDDTDLARDEEDDEDRRSEPLR